MRMVAAIFYVVVLAICSLGIQEGGGVPVYPSVRFDVSDAVNATTYGDFITALREIVTWNATTDPGSDLPMLPSDSVEVGDRFVLVHLSSGVTVTVTLAIDVVDLFVVAFSSNGNKSYFFKDKFMALQRDNLFVGTSQTKLSYEGNYRKLGNRKKIDLGIGPLASAISSLWYYNSVPKPLAVVIQMVSEAARFKHIEESVRESITGEYTFKPKGLIVSMENQWTSMSTKILGMDDATGHFKGSVQLDYDNGTSFEVKDYNTLRNYTMIAILKCKSGTLSFSLSRAANEPSRVEL